MRSSVFTLPADTPFDASGYLLDAEGNVVPGYVRVGQLPADTVPVGGLPARVVVHAAEGRAIPADALSVGVDGSVVDWAPGMLVAAKPEEAPYIMEAEYAGKDADGNDVALRCKMVDLPVGAVVLRTNLVPHLWTGERA